MILACGVRFIRFRSAWVSGCASGSARAARSMASSLIARGELGVLSEVVVLLILCCPPRRNDTNPLAAYCVSHKQNNVTLCHPDNDETFFAIVFPIIEALDGERVFKDRLGQIEAHAVGFEVGLCFRVVPFKFQSQLYYGIPVVMSHVRRRRDRPRRK